MIANAGDDPRITVEEAMARLRLVCAAMGADMLPPAVTEDLWTGKPMVVPDRPHPLVEYEGSDGGVLYVADYLLAFGATLFLALVVAWVLL